MVVLTTVDSAYTLCTGLTKHKTFKSYPSWTEAQQWHTGWHWGILLIMLKLLARTKCGRGYASQLHITNKSHRMHSLLAAG